MRRMNRLYAMLCALIIIAGLAIPALATEGRDPYQPVRVETFDAGDGGAEHKARIYQLSPVDDPTGIPTQDFEDGGWVYHMVDMTHEEETGTDSRRITRTVTKSSDTDDTAKILRKLDATMEVTTQDGYSGTLLLDHTSVSVEAAGYATRNDAVSAVRVYPDLADADLSLIPKTIEENGKTLSLDDVQWEEGWQTDAESGYIRYSATASYVGTVSSRYATGYTVSANYTGEVSRPEVEMITWRVEFAPVRKTEPVEEPPQPESPAMEEDTSKNKQGAYNAEESGANADAEDDTFVPADAELVQPKFAHDYSGLKRTLMSCGLLLALAGGAGIIRKIREKGERRNQ